MRAPVSPHGTPGLDRSARMCIAVCMTIPKCNSVFSPEASNLVVFCPVHQVINHQTLSHAMLCRSVVAARAVTNSAIFCSAVVVPRHNFVEDTVTVQARSKCVVVHHILHNAQPHVMQSLHPVASPVSFKQMSSSIQSTGAQSNAAVGTGQCWVKPMGTSV
jgi:hypothetical protein